MRIIHAMLCSNPTHNLSWRVDGSVTPCNNLTNWPRYVSVQDLRQSSAYQTLVHDNDHDIRSSHCQRCWDKESLNLDSKRITDNQQHEIYAKLQSNYIKVDAAIGSVCNAACRICGPDSSSLWQYENKKFHDVPLIPHQPTDLWNFIDQAQDQILQLDFGGGEPWLNDIDQQIKLLTKLCHRGRSGLIKLRYNTNGSVYPKRLINLFQNFRQVEITLSIDDTHNRFEYNRYPLKWARVNQNVKKLQALTHSYNNIVLGINYSVSVFTFLYTEQFATWARANDLNRINWNIVHNPLTYNIKSLPQSVKDKLSTTNQFYDVVAQVPMEHWKNQFDAVTHKLDVQRKQNFAAVFPELVELLK